jgi:hypothetical protein
MARLILNTKNANWLKAVSNKYSKDFIPFYDSLAKEYQSIGIKDTTEIAKSSLAVVKAIEGINQLLNPAVFLTQKDLDKALKLVSKVNTEFNKWLASSKKDKETNKILEKVLDKEGLDLKRLSEQQKVIKGRTEGVKLEKESLWSQFQDFSPELAEGIKGVGGYLGSNLGTVGTLGSKAWGVGRGIVQGIKRRKLAAEHKSLAGSIIPMNEETPEGFAKILRSLSLGGRASIGEDTLGALKGLLGGEKQAKGATGSVGGLFSGLTGGMVGGAGAGNLVSGLFSFFNSSSGMLKTKWSKELFALLEKGESKKPIKEKASTTILGGLSGALIPLGVALGVLIMGAIQAAVFMFLKDKLGDTGALTVASGPSTALSDLASKATVDFIKGDKKKPTMGGGNAGLVGGVSEFITDRISSTFNKKSIEQVPLGVDTRQSDGLTKLYSSLDALLEESKKNNEAKAVQVGMSGGYDAWNIRNPNLDNIVTANADLDQ